MWRISPVLTYVPLQVVLPPVLTLPLGPLLFIFVNFLQILLIICPEPLLIYIYYHLSSQSYHTFQNTLLVWDRH